MYDFIFFRDDFDHLLAFSLPYLIQSPLLPTITPCCLLFFSFHINHGVLSLLALLPERRKPRDLWVKHDTSSSCIWLALFNSVKFCFFFNCQMTGTGVAPDGFYQTWPLQLVSTFHNDLLSQNLVVVKNDM
jgi:hypothetical protein